MKPAKPKVLSTCKKTLFALSFLGAAATMLPGDVHADGKIVDMNILVNITSNVGQAKTQDLNFGTIDALGVGTCDVVLKATSASSTINPSDVTGKCIIAPSTASVGIIEITSAQGMDFTIAPTYPQSVTIPGVGTVDQIQVNSKIKGSGGSLNHTGGQTSKIFVGGRLKIDPNPKTGPTSTPMQITINYL